MAETGKLLSLPGAELLDVLQSLRFHARRLADDHPGDFDLTRAVDALDERVDAFVEAVRPARYRDLHILTFRVKPLGHDHQVILTSRDRDAMVVFDDAAGIATPGLVGGATPTSC